MTLNISPFLSSKSHFSKDEAQLLQDQEESNSCGVCNWIIKNIHILNHIPSQYRHIYLSTKIFNSVWLLYICKSSTEGNSWYEFHNLSNLTFGLRYYKCTTSYSHYSALSSCIKCIQVNDKVNIYLRLLVKEIVTMVIHAHLYTDQL